MRVPGFFVVKHPHEDQAEQIEVSCPKIGLHQKDVKWKNKVKLFQD